MFGTRGVNRVDPDDTIKEDLFLDISNFRDLQNRLSKEVHDDCFLNINEKEYRFVRSTNNYYVWQYGYLLIDQRATDVYDDLALHLGLIKRGMFFIKGNIKYLRSIYGYIKQK